ncbi:hypothetical protein N7466_005837 [Penicillium verhagenii]|uniref:uncharacterized protein n=1 Tax=Penicillium verhagenii TaxID=1562060 RepID=UPI0025458493|nr:uncharacterized protein N7466_005837 [Penicillium verhagenii]KAJ5930344.1 hypothetical protein N7466_005837 [Penicillium verhagenii]
MVAPKVHISAQARTALQANLTIRCLLAARFVHHISRCDGYVIPWAGDLVLGICRAIAKKIKEDCPLFNFQMSMIQMLGSANIVFICFDLFLNHCDQKLMTNIHTNYQLQWPIYYISERGNSYSIQRNEQMDPIVAEKYLSMGKFYQEKRPFFFDYRKKSGYDPDGQRREDCQDLLAYEVDRPEDLDLSSSYDNLSSDGDLGSYDDLGSDVDILSDGEEGIPNKGEVGLGNEGGDPVSRLNGWWYKRLA